MAQTIKLKRSAVAGRIPTVSDLALGEVAINTVDGKMYIKKDVAGTESIVEIGSGSATSIWKQYVYTAGVAQTVFTGADDNSDTLAYSVNFVEVFLNGILLDPAVDYTATNNTSVVLTSAPATGDLLQIDTFAKSVGIGDTVLNSFTGDNSTTAFTLSTNPGDENNTSVFIGGVYQNKTTYSVSGTTLTFSEAPATAAEIEVVIGSRNVSLTDIADLSITGVLTASGGTSTNWNTAYGWGNHASAGYLTTDSDTTYSAGTGVTLTGTTFSLTDTAAKWTQDNTKISNWDTAYGWGDHSTATYATQSYVGTAISNLVDSSPSTLDTLNELAAALGDDPNFATTTATAIGLKAPIASPTFTGTVAAAAIHVPGAGNIATNEAFGTGALQANTYGTANVASGGEALYSNTTGSGNVANGYQALYSNTTGDDNTATGNQALYSNTYGFKNVASGGEALYSNTTGNYNIATGYQSLKANTTGVGNVSTGYQALTNNTSGGYNVASGVLSLYRNTTGSNNTAYGNQSQYQNRTGTENVAIGYYSNRLGNGGSYNTALGSKSNHNNVSGLYNTSVGYNAGYNLTGSNNTVIGSIAGEAGISDTVIIGAGTTERLRIDSSGNVGIGTSSPAQKLHITDSAPFARLESTSTSYNGFTTKNDSGNFYFGIDDSGGNFYGSAYARAIYADGAYPVTFYTNATERMRIDASGQVRLSNTTPVWDTTFNSLVTKGGFVGSQSTSYLYSGQNLYFDGSFKYSTSAAATLYEQSFGNHIFYNAPSGTADNAVSLTQAMTLDASGNLLVGTNNPNVHIGTASGAVITSAGFGFFAVTGNSPIYANRLTNDGAIIDLRKDGVSVGSIGTVNGDLLVGTGDTAFRFHDGDNRIYPVNVSDGIKVDGAVDLGDPTGRFKDLYLSGGVYLGGTGAANLLDDYEEGTWTPVLSKGTTAPSVTYNTQNGTYTKVGRMIYVSGLLSWTAISGGTGAFHITGLPFTILSSAGAYPQLVCIDYNGVTFGANDTTFGGYGAINGTYIVLLASKNNATNSTVISGLATSGFMYFNLTYQAA